MNLFKHSIQFHRIGLNCRWASSALTDKGVKVPLNIYSLEGRYATALYTAAIHSGGPSQLDVVSKDLATLSSYIAKAPKAKEFLNDPTLNRLDKKAAVLNLMPKLLGSKPASSSLVTNLLGLLAENGRLAELTKIITSFEELMRAHRKEIPVTIITATEMDSDFAKKLNEKILKQFIPADRTPIVTTKVDSSLLGGLVVHIDDKTIDLSVATKVNQINKALDRGL